MTALQASLLDPGPDAPPPPLDELLTRTELGRGAWIDVGRSWVPGAGDLCEELLRAVDWQAERRVIFQRVVDVPRLARFYDGGEARPHAAVERLEWALAAHYRGVAGGRFRTVGCCLYRDGRDSVAWHGDRIGLGATEDTLVAIVSLGASRRLLLRPRGGGTAWRFDLGSGDLLVMGGSCQRTWEHAVPKTARPIGPRISVQFRPAGVR